MLDLSQMKRIIDFSEELGYITIEPGVSILDVVEFLDERQSKLMLPMGGTSPKASLIGHMSERGISIGTAYHDRASHVCGIKAVLGSGKVIHTGMRRYDQNALSGTHRWAPGPSIESMLSQSDFSIITEATIWLPTGSESSFFVLAISDDLSGLVNAFRDCERDGLRTATQIYNRHKVEKLFFARSKPVDIPLPPGNWVAMTPVYPASKHHEQADKKLITSHLKKVDKCGSLYLPMTDKMGPFNGRPYANDDVLLGMLYRWGEEQKQANIDPQRDRCGILWGCYASPLVGSELQRACSIIDRVLSSYELDVLQSIHTLSERACLLFPQLSFPIEQAELAKRAVSMLTTEMNKAGFVSYRVPVGLGGVPSAADDHDEVMADIRAVLDPNNVMARGKYRSSP